MAMYLTRSGCEWSIAVDSTDDMMWNDCKDGDIH
jgi:hypothetical protein